MRYFDDEPDPAMRPRQWTQLTCPYCPQVVVGLDPEHATALLLIHQEAACPGHRGGEQT